MNGATGGPARRTLRDRRVAALGIAVVLLALAGHVAARHRAVDVTGTLAGRVSDLTNGRPLGGATVHAGTVVATSAEDGQYRLALPVGRYEVRVERPGFTGATLPDQVVARDVRRLDVALPPEQVGTARMLAAAARVRAQRGAGVARSSGTRETAAAEVVALPRVTTVPDVIRVLMPDGEIVPLETDTYLRGVVPAEMGYLFRRTLAALQAQAIASRTYAATHCLPDSAGDPQRCEPGLDANVDTTTRTQVWRGVYFDISDQAVAATRGQVVRVDGTLVPTLFFARTNGRTLDSEDSPCCGGKAWPFLRAVSSPEAFAVRWGHGAGMSQEGAATLADWGASGAEILRHYYTGITIDPVVPVTATVIAAHAGGGTEVGAPESGEVASVRAGSVTFQASELRATDEGELDAAATEGTVTVESPVVHATFPFMALAAEWQGGAGAADEVVLEVRTRDDGELWSDWTPLPVGVADEDAKEPALPGERWTSLLIDRGRDVQLRATVPAAADGPTVLERITLHYLNGDAGPVAPEAGTLATGPTVVSRAAWGADERLRFDADGDEIWPAEYTVPRAQIVHHTVTANAPADPAAVVRTIYHYHAVTRGWGDIGYNFLVDHRGNIYEGRHGGERSGRIVQGGHALQYNSNTIGVAVLGTFTAASTRPTDAAVNGLVELLAAKGVTFGVAPGSPVTLLGNRFAYGVLGHRDVLPGHTACPGDGLAARLADVRTRVAARMAQIVVRPTPSATPRPAPSRTSTATTAPPTPPPLPDACVDRVTNGGFESDTDDWIRNRAYYSSWDVHAGRRAMFVGLRDSDPDAVQTYASASQVVRLPASPGRAQLSFVARTVGHSGDRLIVRVMDAQGAIIALAGVSLPASSPWATYRHDLDAALAGRAGQDVRLYFAVINNGDGQRSYLRLDDVALRVCPPGAGTASASGTPDATAGTAQVPTSTASATTATTAPSPTPTPSPTATPTTRATSSPAPTRRPATATPTRPPRTPSPTAGPVCADVVAGGDFEDADLPGWQTSGGHPAARTRAAAHEGDWALRLGLVEDGPDAFDYAAAAQAITLPVGVVSATLSLWVRPIDVSPEDAVIVELRRPADGTRIRLLGPQMAAAPGEWSPYRLALPVDRPGRDLQIYLAVLNRGQDDEVGGRTAVAVDDVALVVCARPPVRTYTRHLPWATGALR